MPKSPTIGTDMAHKQEEMNELLLGVGRLVTDDILDLLKRPEHLALRQKLRTVQRLSLTVRSRR
jgi:hypothetical protein